MEYALRCQLRRHLAQAERCLDDGDSSTRSLASSKRCTWESGVSCEFTRFSIRVANNYLATSQPLYTTSKHFHWCYEFVVAVQLWSHHQLGLRLRLNHHEGGDLSTSNFYFSKRAFAFSFCYRVALSLLGNHESEAKSAYYCCIISMRSMKASSLSRQPYLCLVMFFRERDTHFILFWFVRKHWDGMGWNFGTQLELIDWIYLGVNCDLFGHFHMWDGAWGMFFIRRENLHFSWLRMSD